MSDDLPTRRYDQIPGADRQPTEADSTPTRRFEPLPQPGAPAAPPGVPPAGPGGPGGGRGDGTGGTGPGDEPQKNPRALIITLSVIGGVLFIAIVILATVLLTRGSSPTATSSPTASSTPSATPSQSASPSPSPSKSTAPTTPPSTAPAVSSFTVTTPTVTCETGKPDPTLAFSWTSSNAAEAYFGVDTQDAQANPYYSSLPPNGDSSAFPDTPFTFSCPAASHVYTITVVGSGKAASRSITVTNNGG